MQPSIDYLTFDFANALTFKRINPQEAPRDCIQILSVNKDNLVTRGLSLVLDSNTLKIYKLLEPVEY